MAEPTFELMSTWLANCSANHQLCKLPSPPKLPFRIIDVLSRDDPFLLETNGQHGHYFALSYCWGKQRFTDMMSFGPNSKGKRGQPDPMMNIENHKLRISYSAMPKTLQDAVIVSRRLGNRYLWIDALCIVQGDDEEWDREHLKMADIYSNAKLVLAADNADGLEKGFLKTKLETPQSQANSRSKSVAKARAGSVQPRREIMISPSPLSLDEPLNRRAWSLSEVIFANRVIHFATSKMIWECNEMRHYEGGIPHIFHEHDDDSFRVFRNTAIARRSSKTELYRKWNLLVASFTKRQINNSPEETHKDAERLVALSRVARRFSWILREIHRCEDEYLAGMWREDLETSLLWSTEDCLQEDSDMQWRRPVAPRAPSWSWAAIEGPISIEPRIRIQFGALIEEATVEHLKSDDPFGRVLSGRLVVRGNVLHNLHLQLEDHDGSMHVLRHACMAFGPASDNGFMFILDVPLSQQLYPRISCLLLGEGEVETASEETQKYYAILLLRAVSVAPLIFERVGISARHGQSASVSKILDAMTDERVTIV